jgi:DNA-binding HxlR family transcriptional regulator
MNTTQGSRTASSIFIGRWTPKVFVLAKRQALSRQLRRQLGSVSQRILTRTLRNLESAGLIARRVTLSKAIYCRVFVGQTGRDDHRSTQRHVPLGKAIPQGRER